MEFDPEDQDIIQLLTKLREAEAKYPEELLAARRQSYLRQMGEIGLGIGAERGIEGIVKDGKTPNPAPAASTLIETILVVAIIVEALTVTYFYRDKLAGFVRTIIAQASVQGVTPTTVISTSMEIQAVTPSSVLTATIPSAATLTLPIQIPVTGTSTPIPGVAEENSSNAAGVNLLNATPAANELNGNQTNNGNHYGQTPKPERTKENGNNPPPKDNEEKPPKDNSDKPPKENNDKPPKDNSDQPPNDNKDKQPKKP